MTQVFLKNRRKKLMQDHHMHLHLFNLMLIQPVPQQSMQRINKVFHTLIHLVLTIQELLLWTLMPQFGKELLFMMEKFMERKTRSGKTIIQIKHKKSTTGLTHILRRQINDYLMHQPSEMIDVTLLNYERTRLPQDSRQFEKDEVRRGGMVPLK